MVKSKKRVQNRMRNCMFTLNNPTPEFKEFFKGLEVRWTKDKSLPQTPLPWRFGCGQLEIGESGTPHIQGYFELAKTSAFSTIKKNLPGAPHIEQRRGSPAQAVAYCQKEDTRHPDNWSFVFGESKGQGFRSDLSATSDRVAEEVMEGNTMDEIMHDHPGYYMEKKEKIAAFRSECLVKKTRRDKKFIILYGPTGCGKTATCSLKFPDHHDLIIPHGKGPLWWDGYCGQDAVLIDEFGKGKVPYTTMKRLCDYKAHTYNVKHSSVVANPEFVIVTTTIHPKKWYSGVQHKGEFRRRIREMGELWEFSGEGSYPDFEFEKKPMTDFEFEEYEAPASHVNFGQGNPYNY